jgi:hypothetical protein
MTRRFWPIRRRRIRDTNRWALHPSPTQTITAMAVLVVGLILVGPVGAQAAAALSNVVITDGTNKAHQAAVDGNGNLQVAGSVQIVGTPTVQVPANDPGRSPYLAQVQWASGISASFTVPSGKRLVVRYVSATMSVDHGQVYSLDLPGALFVPVSIGTVAVTDRQTYLVAQATELYFDAGAHPVQVEAFDSGGVVATAFVYLSGYLIDCENGPCGAPATG